MAPVAFYGLATRRGPQSSLARLSGVSVLPSLCSMLASWLAPSPPPAEVPDPPHGSDCHSRSPPKTSQLHPVSTILHRRPCLEDGDVGARCSEALPGWCLASSAAGPRSRGRSPEFGGIESPALGALVGHQGGCGGHRPGATTRPGLLGRLPDLLCAKGLDLV